MLEAMHAGAAIVAHDIPEQRETLGDGGSGAGLLVPLEDLDAWIAAIERLRDDPHFACGMRLAALRRATLFSYEAMISSFEHALLADSS
jgi:glycosyltransferase involved in cell wall biosynthesis